MPQADGSVGAGQKNSRRQTRVRGNAAAALGPERVVGAYRRIGDRLLTVQRDYHEDHPRAGKIAMVPSIEDRIGRLDGGNDGPAGPDGGWMGQRGDSGPARADESDASGIGGADPEPADGS